MIEMFYIMALTTLGLVGLIVLNKNTEFHISDLDSENLNKKIEEDDLDKTKGSVYIDIPSGELILGTKYGLEGREYSGSFEYIGQL